VGVVELLSRGELRVPPLASAVREAQDIVRKSVRRRIEACAMMPSGNGRFVNETYVLNASAVLCLFRRKGADRVAERLPMR